MVEVPVVVEEVGVAFVESIEVVGLVGLVVLVVVGVLGVLCLWLVAGQKRDRRMRQHCCCGKHC